MNAFDDIEPAARVRLGMLTPSSNTALEPLCARMVVEAPAISIHFGRFRVTAIKPDVETDKQFALAPMLAAAGLLADARMHAICWNGTSASWLGLERDRELCAAIEQSTGVPATSATLAGFEALARSGARKVSLVTPYVTEIRDAIAAQLVGAGYRVVANLGLDLTDNFAFAEVRALQLAAMLREAAAAGAEAILVQCTNLAAAPLVEALERETGALILDSVAASLWGALRTAGASPGLIKGWGRLFRNFD